MPKSYSVKAYRQVTYIEKVYISIEEESKKEALKKIEDDNSTYNIDDTSTLDVINGEWVEFN